jgi:hypothetical protein
MTLLRERMAEDLRIRNYSPRTVECYVSMMARFAREFEKPPGQLGPAEIRAFCDRMPIAAEPRLRSTDPIRKKSRAARRRCRAPRATSSG